MNAPSTQLDIYRAEVLPPEKARELYAALPSHIKPAVFERNLMNALMANPSLMDFEPRLIYREVAKSAGLGLLLDPILGEAYIVTAYNYKTRKVEPQLRVGYKGMCKLARQTGEVGNIYSHEVHALDYVECDLGFPKVFHHKPKLFSDRGPIIGYVAIITFKDGTFDFEPMSLEQCLDIRDRSDAWKAFKDGKIKSTPWSTDENEMCKKTDLRRLLKRQAQSPELSEAIRIEDRAEFPDMGNGAPLGLRDSGPPRSVHTIEHQAASDEKTENSVDNGAAGRPDTSNPSTDTKAAPMERAIMEPPQGPHKVLGGKDGNEWSALYIAAMQTSEDTAVVHQWISANIDPLGRLNPTQARRVDEATQKHLDFVRKTGTKTEPKPDPVRMIQSEDPISTGPQRKPMPNFATDYGGWITFQLKQIAATNPGDDMDTLFESIEPFYSDCFPPDQDALASARRQREKYLEP